MQGTASKNDRQAATVEPVKKKQLYLPTSTVRKLALLAVVLDGRFDSESDITAHAINKLYESEAPKTLQAIVEREG